MQSSVSLELLYCKRALPDSLNIAVLIYQADDSHNAWGLLPETPLSSVRDVCQCVWGYRHNTVTSLRFNETNNYSEAGAVMTHEQPTPGP